MLTPDIAAAMAASPAPAGCRAELAGGALTLATPHSRSVWDLTPAGPRPRSWALDGVEILAAPAPDPAPATEPRARLRTFAAPLTVCGAPALHAVLTIERDGAAPLCYQFALTAAGPGVVWERLGDDGAAAATAPEAAPGASGVEGDPAPGAGENAGGAAPLRFAFRAPHLVLRAGVFADQTDVHDNLLRFDEYRLSPVEPLRLAGALFAVTEALPGPDGRRRGFVFLKHAPLPHARPQGAGSGPDWEWDRAAAVLHGEAYPWAAIPFAAPAGEEEAALPPAATAAMQAHQRALRPPRPGLDGLALSNTWGDRHRDAALNEKFVLGEIAAAAEIGVDVCQIDDGWQRGVTSNSSAAAAHGGGVWEGYHATDPDFWAVHPGRFPRGLAPLAAASRERGVGLGLWFSPDSAADFANWQKDAATVIGLREQWGVHWVKIDGVKSRSRAGEANLRRFFAAVARDGAATAFDLDVTAEVRPGYFGMPEFGALFVENRYTDWHRWWPTATFRNLWQLAQAIPPARLRMEVLNPDRNRELYAGDPLAPELYGLDWAFFAVMVSSPLLWCELQSLAPARRAELRPLVALWKRYRAELHGGTVLPVGRCPDGEALSGFMALDGDGEPLHLLLLRDAGAEEVFPLPACARRHQWAKIAGAGRWDAAAPGGGTARLPEKRSYLWLRRGV